MHCYKYHLFHSAQCLIVGYTCIFILHNVALNLQVASVLSQSEIWFIWNRGSYWCLIMWTKFIVSLFNMKPDGSEESALFINNMSIYITYHQEVYR